MRRVALAACLLVLMLGFLRSGPLAAQAVRDGLTLCAHSVIPSLFPFFVVVSCFIRLGLAQALGRLFTPIAAPVLGCSGAGAVAFFLGLMGGYPVGGRTVAELYAGGSIGRMEAERLLTFCNNCGPAFVLGVAGMGCFGSLRVGLWLYAIHVVSALLAAQLYRPRRQRTGPLLLASPAATAPAALVGAITDGAGAMVSVCAFVVFCGTALRLAASVTGLSHPALLGAVELTGGILALAPDRGGFITAAALLGWGGLSVHGQTAAVLGGTDLSLWPHLFGKAVQTVFSALLALPASRFLF